MFNGNDFQNNPNFQQLEDGEKLWWGVAGGIMGEAETSDNEESPPTSPDNDASPATENEDSPMSEETMSPHNPEYSPRSCGHSQIIEEVMYVLTEGKNLLVECPPFMERKTWILKGILDFWQWQVNGMRNNLHGMNSVVDNAKIPKPSRILIGTRNFHECANFLKEMNDAPLGTTNLLRNIKASCLAPRKNLCLNEEVVTGTGNFDHSCRKLISRQRPEGERSCEHFQCSSSDVSLPLPFVRESIGGITDIEDFIGHCRVTRRCPYFDAIHEAGDAQLVIFPVKFLVSPFLREEYNLKLDNSIVLVDDGHDLENLCRKEASIEISVDDLNKMSTFIQAVNNDYQQTQREDIGFAELENFLPTLYEFVSGKDEAEDSPDRDELLEVFNQLSASSLNVHLLLKTILKYEENSAHLIQDVDANIVDELRKLITIIPLLLDNNEAFTVKVFSRRSPSNPDRVDTIIKIICADPSVILKPIERAANSLIIGANIIAPYPPFHSEFGVTFEVLKVQQDDPIMNERLPFLFACKGVTGKEFALEFNSRDEPKVKKEVGWSLLEICKVIPNGKLVLFHSKGYMSKCIAYWKKTSTEPGGSKIMEQIHDTVTKVFSELDMEMKTDDKIEEIMHQFEEASKSKKGALLLALHRGILFKNWDLKYQSVRGIVHISMPWGPLPWDDHLYAKKQYMERKDEEGESEWHDFYHSENFRVLNQSLCIVKPTGRNDWGAVIVFDRRMLKESRESRERLPEWGKHLKYCENFPELKQIIVAKVQEFSEDT